MKPRHIAATLLGIILATLLGVAIYSHVRGDGAGRSTSSSSSANSATALGANCTKGRVTYYATKAAPGSYRFDALQTGHALKPTVKYDITKLCHDPAYAAATVDYTKTGKLRPPQVNALARHYLHNRKAWLHDIIGLLNMGSKKNGVTNPTWAVTSFSVKYQSSWYHTEGMVPHGKNLPTVKRYTETHAAGWVLVEHLANGQTREQRINCGEQPVVTYKHAVKTVAARPSSPTVVTVVYHQPPPPGCTGTKCAPHHQPPPKCTTKCGHQPPPCKTHCGPPPPCKSHCGPPPCKGSKCGPPPPCKTNCGPPPCKTHCGPPPCKTNCGPPPPCSTCTSKQPPPVQDPGSPSTANDGPTPGAPSQAPAPNPVATTSGSGTTAQAPAPAPDNGPGKTAGYAGSGTGTGGTTPGGSTSDSGGTTANGGSSATSNPTTGDTGTYSGSPTGPPS